MESDRCCSHGPRISPLLDSLSPDLILASFSVNRFGYSGSACLLWVLLVSVSCCCRSPLFAALRSINRSPLYRESISAHGSPLCRKSIFDSLCSLRDGRRLLGRSPEFLRSSVSRAAVSRMSSQSPFTVQIITCGSIRSHRSLRSLRSVDCSGFSAFTNITAQVIYRSDLHRLQLVHSSVDLLVYQI